MNDCHPGGRADAGFERWVFLLVAGRHRRGLPLRRPRVHALRDQGHLHRRHPPQHVGDGRGCSAPAWDRTLWTAIGIILWWRTWPLNESSQYPLKFNICMKTNWWKWSFSICYRSCSCEQLWLNFFAPLCGQIFKLILLGASDGLVTRDNSDKMSDTIQDEQEI